MRYYFAPMEGITDSIYRRVHHTYFGGVNRYYMPFISPTMHRCLTHKEQRDLPPAQSVPFEAVPQILTKVSGDFLWAAQVVADQGYAEVNLNLGCPSGTVVAKGKGSGMLRDLDGLDRFLDEIFAHSPLPISVKTRLGLEDGQEFPAILQIFNRYPIRELIIHPRVRKQFYDGSVDMEMFRYATEHTHLPLCYNGDLNSKAHIDAFSQEFPQIQAVMLGRGLIGNPAMLSQPDVARLEAFTNTLLEEYTIAFGSSRNAMFRMKENWRSMVPHFEGSEKLWKRLRKTTDIVEFKNITAEIFHNCPWVESP